MHRATATGNMHGKFGGSLDVWFLKICSRTDRHRHTDIHGHRRTPLEYFQLMTEDVLLPQISEINCKRERTISDILAVQLIFAGRTTFQISFNCFYSRKLESDKTLATAKKILGGARGDWLVGIIGICDSRWFRVWDCVENCLHKVPRHHSRSL